MSSYVLIGASDPTETIDGGRLYELGAALVEHGDDVVVFLVQNGVLACRTRSAPAAGLAALTAGATVLADDFSLRERGISETEVVAWPTDGCAGSTAGCASTSGARATGSRARRGAGRCRDREPTGIGS